MIGVHSDTLLSLPPMFHPVSTSSSLPAFARRAASVTGKPALIERETMVNFLVSLKIVLIVLGVLAWFVLQNSLGELPNRRMFAHLFS